MVYLLLAVDGFSVSQPNEWLCPYPEYCHAQLNRKRSAFNLLDTTARMASSYSGFFFPGRFNLFYRLAGELVEGAAPFLARLCILASWVLDETTT